MVEIFANGSIGITGPEATYTYSRFQDMFEDMPTLEQIKEQARKNACSDIIFGNRHPRIRTRVELEVGTLLFKWRGSTRNDLTLVFFPTTATIGEVEDAVQVYFDLQEVYRLFHDEPIPEITPYNASYYLKVEHVSLVENRALLN